MATGNMFLKLGDIKGQATESDHKDWIEIKSYHYGITMEVSPGSGGVARTGRPKFDRLKLVKAIDRVSPVLAESVSSGAFFTSAEINVLESAGSSMNKQMVIKMENVHIASVMHDSDGATQTTETIELAFGKIKWEATTMDTKNKPQTLRGGWDADENKKWA